jgi:fermentation-respiration switch protein FrsA (DUF1100 family)
MRRFRLSLFAAASLVVLPAAALAQVTESDVTFLSEGQEVVATLSVPGGDPAPVVLLLHGFTGSRDELATEHVPEGVFARTAARLAEAGFASLRIDFRGSGESVADLAFADTTFEGQVADALAAIAYLSGLDSVAADTLHVIGWSQGGLVASAVAGRSDAVDSAVLWNAVADPMATFGAIIGPETMEKGLQADAAEPIPVTLPWAEIALKGAFFDGIESFSPTEEIAAYSGPLLVVQGSLDTTVPPASADMFLAAHDGPETLWTAEMDHVFNVFTEGEMLETMIADTIAFLRAQES